MSRLLGSFRGFVACSRSCTNWYACRMIDAELGRRIPALSDYNAMPQLASVDISFLINACEPVWITQYKCQLVVEVTCSIHEALILFLYPSLAAEQRNGEPIIRNVCDLLTFVVAIFAPLSPMRPLIPDRCPFPLRLRISSVRTTQRA